MNVDVPECLGCSRQDRPAFTKNHRREPSPIFSYADHANFADRCWVCFVNNGVMRTDPSCAFGVKIDDQTP